MVHRRPPFKVNAEAALDGETCSKGNNSKYYLEEGLAEGPVTQVKLPDTLYSTFRSVKIVKLVKWTDGKMFNVH